METYGDYLRASYAFEMFAVTDDMNWLDNVPEFIGTYPVSTDGMLKDTLVKMGQWWEAASTKAIATVISIFEKARASLGVLTGYSVKTQTMIDQRATRLWTPPKFLDWLSSRSLYISGITQELMLVRQSRMATNAASDVIRELTLIGSASRQATGFSALAINQATQRYALSESQLRKAMTLELKTRSDAEKKRLLLKISELRANDASIDHAKILEVMKAITEDQIAASGKGITWLKMLAGEAQRIFSLLISKVISGGLTSATMLLRAGGAIFALFGRILRLAMEFLKSVSSAWHGMFGVSVIQQEDLDLENLKLAGAVSRLPVDDPEYQELARLENEELAAKKV